MHRIDNASANEIKPARENPGPKPNSFFDEASQTIVTDDWLNAVQEELVNLLTEAGIIPDKADDTQVKAALDVLYKVVASSTVKGIIELATVAEVIAGTDTERAITPAALQALVASASAAGIIELANAAEVAAGTDTERAVTPAGLRAAQSRVVLDSKTANNSAYIDFNDFPAGYKAFEVEFFNALPSIDAPMDARVFVGGVLKQNPNDYINTAQAASDHASLSSVFVSNDVADSGANGALKIINPINAACKTPLRSINSFANQSSQLVEEKALHRYDLTGAVDGVRLYFAVANIVSGDFNLIGIK